MDNIVYILGAGCSAGPQPDYPGYPLAKGFILALREFKLRLDLRDNCKGIKACVERCIALLQNENVPTIDRLVARLESQSQEAYNSGSNEIPFRNREDIYKARIATNALFMDLETSALGTGLHQYDLFLDKLFGTESSWARASEMSTHTVLTFNYDRLFEASLLRRFSIPAGLAPLYGHKNLNSGMDAVQCVDLGFRQNGFAFLKLHGSIGIWVQENHDHGPVLVTQYDGWPGRDAVELNDAHYFPDRTKSIHMYRPEPLIVFPHEKPFVAEGTGSRFFYRSYIPPIWKEAYRRISSATEIRAIGYSFAPVDKESVLGLLRHATNCQRLLIQNRPEAVDDICERLKHEWLIPEGIDLPVVPFRILF